MMNNLEDLNLNSIKIERERKRYSQEYMARCLGISQSYYSKLENQISPLKIDQLREIMRILDLNNQMIKLEDESIDRNIFATLEEILTKLDEIARVLLILKHRWP